MHAETDHATVGLADNLRSHHPAVDIAHNGRRPAVSPSKQLKDVYDASMVAYTASNGDDSSYVITESSPSNLAPRRPPSPLVRVSKQHQR